MTEKISGLLAAPFTPMHSNGAIDIDRIPAMVDLLVNNGIKGIFVCGSTGEGPSLTGSERKQLAKAFVEASAKRLKVFIHVGQNSLEESSEEHTSELQPLMRTSYAVFCLIITINKS